VLPPIRLLEQGEGPDRKMVSAPAPNPVAEKIDLLQRRDPRLAHVRAELSNGIVSLSGTAPRWEQIYDLARAIAKLPGVERVVLKDVQADAQP